MDVAGCLDDMNWKIGEGLIEMIRHAVTTSLLCS
jgi:hypothetical protein